MTAISSINVEKVLERVFPSWRPVRSTEYMQGVRAALLFRLSAARPRTPYAEGTCQFDAYIAGKREGMILDLRSEK